MERSRAPATGQVRTVHDGHTETWYAADARLGSRKRERQRYGEPMLKKVRQLIESVNDTFKGQLDTFKGQLDLEEHGGQSFEGSRSGSHSASWRWSRRSGMTTRPAGQSPGH